MDFTNKTVHLIHTDIEQSEKRAKTRTYLL